MVHPILSEDIVIQLLEEERKARVKKVAETKKITTEDCLVIATVGLNREVAMLREEVAGLRDNMATKEDIRRLEVATKEDIRRLEGTINTLKWLTLAGIAFLTLLISILKFI